MKSRVGRESSGDHRVGGRLYVVALVAATALLAPAGASAASPVLEFVVPGHGMPVSFTTESGAVNAEMAGFESLVHCAASHGEGQITGPRSTVSKYRFTGCVTERGSHEACESPGAANPEEITTVPIEAELVYIDQARHEVGMLINPSGGIYISFKCGGVPAEGRGSFLAPVGPLNQEATSFTATLDQFDSVQTPDEYENESGELRQAIPTGKKGTDVFFVPTGVEAMFTVDTSVPLEIKAVTSQEIETKQHEQEALQEQEAALKMQGEALKRAEEHAKQLGEEAYAAATKKHQEEEAAAKKEREELERAKPHTPTRGQLLSRALRRCQKLPKKQRPRCVASAHRKYGARAEKARLAQGVLVRTATDDRVLPRSR